ncbi:MAG: hypothetical protein HC842_08590 [Cytophagales bacterium]|nr:hypothetical protein [Cytophagales bacterium]
MLPLVEEINIYRQNALHLGLTLELRQADMLSIQINELFDLVVSNPPYIPASERERMISLVTEHEPHDALFVPDDDPLIFYKALGRLALDGLVPGGWLYLECHEDRTRQVVDLMSQMGLARVELRQDLQDKDRMVRAQKPWSSK